MPVREFNEEKNTEWEKEVWERHLPTREHAWPPDDRIEMEGKSYCFQTLSTLSQEQRWRDLDQSLSRSQTNIASLFELKVVKPWCETGFGHSTANTGQCKSSKLTGKNPTLWYEEGTSRDSNECYLRNRVCISRISLLTTSIASPSINPCTYASPTKEYSSSWLLPF